MERLARLELTRLHGDHQANKDRHAPDPIRHGDHQTGQRVIQVGFNFEKDFSSGGFIK